MLSKAEYETKVKLVSDWCRHYYNGTPIATDEEYDKLIQELIEYEKANLASKDSPTSKVGYEVNQDVRKVERKVKMYSLNNVYNIEELKSWLEKTQKTLGSECKFVVSPKYDGCSMDVVYEDGKMKLASTRGDGWIGELVTENAEWIFGVSRETNIKDPISVRGEVVVRRDVFERINKKFKTPFSNPRNYASGSLRLQDYHECRERELMFIPWGVVSDNLKTNSYKQALRDVYYSSNGFADYESYFVLCDSINMVLGMVKHYENSRSKSKVDLDGCVITVDDISLQNKLGHTAKAPRFSIAYKFPPKEVATTLIGIEPRVADTGVITPVGLIKPVTIDGKVIKKVTLHNYNHIAEKDIRINDHIAIILSGDVIPKISTIFKDRRTGDEIKIEKPIICFTCGGPVKEIGAKVVCENCRK